MKKMWTKLRFFYGWLKVWLGLAQWAKMQYNRPKFSRCAYHGLMMKRGRKTARGALYWCPKCRCEYLLECGGNKLVPISVR